MGNTDSAQKLGERVITARKKLEEDKKAQELRSEYLKTKSPETMKVVMQTIAESFKRCAPFLEATLLIAWNYDERQCKEIILKSCKNVLSAPIRKDEYLWFKKYVFHSSVWMFETKTNPKRFMYEELMDISDTMSHDLLNAMDGIYDHLKSHPKFNQLMDIKNETIISRQDNKRVGLLQERGIRHIYEVKENKEETADDIDMAGFIDSNLAINILTTTAKTINQEFQNHMKTVMNHYGDFQPGPMKQVERCVSKLENDYQESEYPKAAKLLDLVRCSVTFNTIDQLIVGYKALMQHIDKNPTMMELARIKNGFLDPNYDGGYRDIKCNVVYHSPINMGVSMICEVQLLLGQFLYEKKRIHKIYAIQREKLYFEMVVKQEEKSQSVKNVKELKFKQVLNIAKETSFSNINYNYDRFYKSSIDTELGLLGIEGKDGWFGVVDCRNMMNTKKPMFEIQRDTTGHHGRQTHHWISHKNERLLSIQTAANEIKMFPVKTNKENKYEAFKEEKYKLNTKGVITYCEFDGKFENMFLVTDQIMLEKRSMANMNDITHNIKLEEKIESCPYRNFRLSADGSLCAVSGGWNHNYVYIIDIEKGIQQKLISKYLKTAYVPCFINGDNHYIAAGGSGKIEIWDIEKKKSFKTFSFSQERGCYVRATASTHNIFAFGSSDDKKLRLYDVRNWECFYTQPCNNIDTRSLHLTPDLKYVTLAGRGGDRCVVLEIK